MKFSIGIAKFLLLIVLCVASWSRVEAENKVTLNNFKPDVPDNDVIDSWNNDLANNQFTSTINVKKNCPGVVEVEIKVYKDGDVVNTLEKMFEHPMNDFANNNICGSVDSPEPDDDTCSMAEGEHCAKDCDMSSWFSDMDPGDYRVECDIKQKDNILTKLIIEVTVESG